MRAGRGPFGLAAAVALGAFGSIAAAAPPAAGDHPAGGQIVTQPKLFTSNDLLLFEVDAAGHQLNDGFGAYGSRAGLFLPLGELARLLDLAISVDPARGRAEGWVLSQDRPLRLDLATRRIELADKSMEFAETQAVGFQGDIYVRTDLIEQILPLTLKIDQASLVIEVVPKAKFPFQDRLDRELRQGGLATSFGAAEEVLRVRTPYRAFSPPAFDVNLLAGGGNRDGSSQKQVEVRAAGDLAYAGFQSFVGTDSKGSLSDVRLLLERKDPDGRAIGVAGITRANIGDTFTPGLLLGARSAGGRGVAFTTGPLEQVNVFDKTDIRGELPAGWQAELYVNEVLRASQLDPVEGRYEFLQVSLVYGLNVIRVVLYGPHGERKEDVRRVNVGAASLARGQVVLSFGAVQEGVQLVDLQRERTIALGGVGELRAVGQLAYGLGGGATMTAGFARYTPRPGDHRTAGTLGVGASVFGIAAELDGALDSASGRAVALGLAGRPYGVSIVARQSEYSHDFIDENQAAAGDLVPLRRATNLNIAYTADLRGVGPLPLSALIERDEYTTGAVRYSATGQVSKPIARYLVSGILDYQSITDDVSFHQLSGELDVSGLAAGNWQVRGGLNYQLVPSYKLSSALLTLDKQIRDRAALRLGVQRTFGPSATTLMSAGATYRFDFADLSLTSSLDTRQGDFRIGLQLAFGLAFDPLQRRYRGVPPGAATGGGIAIDAFRDGDGDGRRAADEAGVQGVKIEGGRQAVVTDDKGRSLTTGLGDGAAARVHVNLDDLDDPYIAAPPQLIEIVPRPGRIAVAPYPIRATGEVELRFSFQRPGDKPRGLSALSVQLVDAAGRVAAEGRTEYDGSLLLEKLRQGTYQVRIEPGQAARLGLALKAPMTVTVGAAGGFVGRLSAEVVAAAPKASPSPPTGAAG